MQWRIMLELAGADGTPQLHEIGAGERSPAERIAATLGLGLGERARGSWLRCSAISSRRRPTSTAAADAAAIDAGRSAPSRTGDRGA